MKLNAIFFMIGLKDKFHSKDVVLFAIYFYIRNAVISRGTAIIVLIT